MTAVAVGALLLTVAGQGLAGAELVVDDLVGLIHAALHLRLAAAGGHAEGERGEEWCSDFRGAFHRWVQRDLF